MEHKYTDGMIDLDVNTVVVDSVGMILFAVYHGIIIIVLVNMLIAMMSHSFESIQVRYAHYLHYFHLVLILSHPVLISSDHLH